MMKQKTLILSLFLAFVLPVLAYEPPITEPGAGGVNPMYTTTMGGPHRTGTNNSGEETYNPEDWLGGSGTDAGDKDANGSPIGAPWILFGFAAAYGAFRLKRS